MGQSKIPIGSPAPNTLAYILDKDEKLTPRGLIGELYIGGKGVVEGYTDEKQNVGKFIDNLFWTGDKLYRTGDLARIQQNGFIEFHGRADSQVKISGHRIELDEIQQVTLTHKDVSEAAAFPIMYESEDSKELGLAFSANKQITIPEITELLRMQLPAFMIPNSILQVDKIKRLPNGKVDLNVLQLRGPRVSAKHPTTTLQNSYRVRQMMHIWGDAMGLDQVPIDVDFFELGGTSLQSIRIIAMCKDMGFKISPAQFLRFSTIETLVASLESTKYERPADTLELEILKIWESNIDQSLIGVNDPYELFGGSKKIQNQLINQIQKEYDVILKFDQKITIRAIAESIRRNEVKVKSNPLKRIIPIKTIGTSNPIFCIHSEFYYETVYSRLVGYLPDHIPAYSVLSISPQLIEDKIPGNIEDIASFCIEDISKIKPSGPYNILSYSIGNVVGFEISKQLIETGHDVRLFIIDPPLYLNKSKTLLGKIKSYISNPFALFSKVVNKVRQPKKIKLIEDTGLLKKYIFRYKPGHVNCDTVFIKTPSTFKSTYDWDSLVNVLHNEVIHGPHDKLMREPYVKQISDCIAKYLWK